MDWHLFRIRPLHLGLVAGLGAVTPDTGHLLNQLTPQVDWSFAHNWGMFFGWLLVASVAGLLAGGILSGRRG